MRCSALGAATRSRQSRVLRRGQAEKRALRLGRGEGRVGKVIEAAAGVAVPLMLRLELRACEFCTVNAVAACHAFCRVSSTIANLRPSRPASQSKRDAPTGTSV